MMAETRISTLRALWSPKLVKVTLSVVAVVAGYDSFSSQFGLPTLGTVLGMSGSLLPWWGWLLILQAIFVYALFEYVRRSIASGGDEHLRSVVKAHERLIEAQVEKRLDVEAQLEKITAEIAASAEDRKAIIRDYQNMRGLEARLDERIDKVEAGARDYASGTADGLVVRLATEVGERVGADESLSERLDEQRGWLSQIDTALNSLKGSLVAIYHRERLLALATEIDERAEYLSQAFADGRKIGDDEWETWKSNELLWEAKIGSWDTFAQFYSPDPIGTVKRINAEDFDGEWSVRADQFPDPEGIRHYKTFRIYFRNWKSLSEVVHQKVRRAAFEGQHTQRQEGSNERSE